MAYKCSKLLRVLTLTLASLVGLSGCTASYTLETTKKLGRSLKVVDHFTIERVNRWSLSPQSSVYIAAPYVGDVDDGTARLGQHIYEAFSKYFAVVEFAGRSESLSDALNSAKQLRCDYVIYPTLMVWEDNASYTELSLFDFSGEWVPSLDKLDLRLKVMESHSAYSVDDISIRAKSGFFTYLNDTPSELLNEPLYEVAKTLAGL